MNRFRYALFPLAMSVALFVAGPAIAQDDGTMTFGEEEAEEVDGGDEQSDQSQSSDGGGEEEGVMTFGEGEDGDEAPPPEETAPVVGVIGVPSDDINDSQRRKLQEKLAETLKAVPNIELQTGSAALDALRERTIATCVTEPLCLGSIGEKAGVDRLVLARVDDKSRGYELEIDYFNIGDRLFIKSESVGRLGSFGSVLDEVQPTIQKMFDMGDRSGGPNFADENTGLAKTVIATSCGVLAAGALTGGIVFGLQADEIETSLNNNQKGDDGVYQDEEFTQSEAKRQLNKAQGKASTANIFYGLSGAFAIASGVLFIVDPGGDVAEDGRRANLLERIDVAPVFGDSGAGFRAEFSF